MYTQSWYRTIQLYPWLYRTVPRPVGCSSLALYVVLQYSCTAVRVQRSCNRSSYTLATATLVAPASQPASHWLAATGSQRDPGAAAEKESKRWGWANAGGAASHQKTRSAGFQCGHGRKRPDFCGHKKASGQSRDCHWRSQRDRACDVSCTG